MEQFKWTTPNKAESQCRNAAMNSPQMCITPVKQSELRFKNTVYHKSTRSFGVLPCHVTPPSGLTKFIARNPFEADLTNKLHLSVISPTVFTKDRKSPQHSPGFSWNIDELATIQPANIEEFPLHQIHCIDPELETQAQAAIDKFFSESQIIPSPWAIKRNETKPQIKLDTTHAQPNNLSSNTDGCRTKKDGWSQTILSLPVQLPPSLEEALQPFFTFTQDQNVTQDNDDANSSTNSLRRKLFFNHDENHDNNESTSETMSPVKMSESMFLSSSPPQSGMLIHGTPVKQSSQSMQRNLGTPGAMSENLSPPNISPIHSTLNRSREIMKSRSSSVAKLDFSMDMSIEYSVRRNRNTQMDSSLDLSLTRANVSPKEKVVESNMRTGETSILKESNSNVSTKNVLSERKSMDFEMNEDNIGTCNKPQGSIQQFKFLTDSCKMFSNEISSVQQMSSLAGMSEQHSACNSAQDTGYQTYSLSSITAANDSCNDTPANQKMLWGNRIGSHEDEVKLCDLKENVNYIFCSTPSRCNREKDSHIF